MTVTANDSRIETAVGDGGVGGGAGSTTIAIDFEFFDVGDIKANQVNDATGAKVLMTGGGTDYTVTGGDGSTGTLTVETPGTTWTSTYRWVVTRDEPDTQTVNPGEASAYDSAAIKKALDRLTMQVQEHVEILTRCVKAPIGDPIVTDGLSMTLPNSVDRASEACEFDASGNVITS